MDTEIDLRELLAILNKGRRFIAAITLAALALGAVYALVIYTPTHQASTLVDLSPYWSGPGYQESTVFAGKGHTQSFLEQCLSRARRENIPEEALMELNFIEVKNTALVEVRASYSDPDLASMASRLAGEELLALACHQKIEALDRQIKVAQASLQRLDQEIEAYRLEYGPLPADPDREEPYFRLLEARSTLLYELSIAAGQWEQLTSNPVPGSAPWISEGEIASPRVAVYRLVFIAAAFILGLLASCFAVFLKYYWHAVKSNDVNS
ncbi:MAG TPA: hypothetical protein GX693_05745 [Firmicutes bacterium]|nr:hypothetical protein [Bacillota bacterium]